MKCSPSPSSASEPVQTALEHVCRSHRCRRYPETLFQVFGFHLNLVAAVFARAQGIPPAWNEFCLLLARKLAASGPFDKQGPSSVPFSKRALRARIFAPFSGALHPSQALPSTGLNFLEKNKVPGTSVEFLSPTVLFRLCVFFFFSLGHAKPLSSERHAPTHSGLRANPNGGRWVHVREPLGERRNL